MGKTIDVNANEPSRTLTNTRSTGLEYRQLFEATWC
jgi:hypothetical protein